MMEAHLQLAGVDLHVLQAARCDRDFACLRDEPDCPTVKFINRDVEVVKCLAETTCHKRHSYDGMRICTCPVRRKLHGL